MEEKISIVIPNYNGRNLLLKNLPNVIKYSQNAEIIVIDDGSDDDSVSLIRKKFKRVRIIKKTKNEGFAKTANLGVLKAKNNYVLLLNSDVSPRRDFLKIAVKNLSPKVFAVGLCDMSHENGKIIARGRGGADFKQGFIRHFPATIEKGETLWVSGGSSIYNKDLFIRFGGFDTIYSPFYWEDIDLSFTAWRSGYICLFEPFSKVDHFHEQGTIKKRNSDFFINMVSYKNQFIFVWKNIEDYYLIIQHILWLPYHLINSFFTFNLAFIIGFIWALASLPMLILNQKNYDFVINEKEIIKKFEKS